jgi:hypothetical protein
MKKNKTLSAFIICCFCSVLTFAQQFSADEKRVFDSQNVIFYGYDFSHFKLADAHFEYGWSVKKIIPAWVGFLNHHTTQESLQKRFKKEKVEFNFDYVTQINNSLKDENLITSTKYTFPIDDIQNIIRRYKLTEKSGIGFVVNIECFEKETKKCSGYYTFFDIETKKVLMSDYFVAKEADGYGLEHYWGTGLNATFGKYVADVYRKKLKAYLALNNK